MVVANVAVALVAFQFDVTFELPVCLSQEEKHMRQSIHGECLRMAGLTLVWLHIAPTMPQDRHLQRLRLARLQLPQQPALATAIFSGPCDTACHQPRSESPRVFGS